MAATTVGTTLTSAVFGTPTFAAINVESFDWSEDATVVDVMDEDGDIKLTAIYGNKVTGTLEGTDNGNTTAVAAAFTQADLPSGTYFVAGRSKKRTNTGFKTTSLSFQGAAY
jgi:hypothetical protein